MRDVYAVTLTPAGDPTETLPIARALVRRWATQDRGGWPKGVDGQEGTWDAPDGAHLSWRSLSDETQRLWVLSVDEPFPGDRSLRWRTIIHVGADDDSTIVHVRLGLVAADPSLAGTVAYEITAPSVVAELVDRVPVYDAGRQLRSEPAMFPTAGQVSELLDNRGRHLPVAVLVDLPEIAGGVAGALAGLAHTVHLDRATATELSDYSLSPFSGSAALCWPTWNTQGYPKRVSYRPDELRQSRSGVGAWGLIRTVYSTSAFRIPIPPLEEALRTAEVRERIAAVENRLKGATPSDELAGIMEAWETDLRALDHARSQIADSRSEAKAARDDLNAVLEAFSEAVDEAADRRASRRVVPAETSPVTSMTEAITAAERDTTHLLFLPEANKSADDSPYQRPGDVYEDLLTVDRLVARWRAGNLPAGFAPAAIAAGLPWRNDVSSTAHQQFEADYARTLPDGREVLLGPHLRYGGDAPPDRLCRVYLWIDKTNQQIVVGHAGRHLRDASNPHR